MVGKVSLREYNCKINVKVIRAEIHEVIFKKPYRVCAYTMLHKKGSPESES